MHVARQGYRKLSFERQTDRQTDRQTKSTEIIVKHAASRVLNDIACYTHTYRTLAYVQGCICQIFTGGQSFDWRLATIAAWRLPNWYRGIAC